MIDEVASLVAGRIEAALQAQEPRDEPWLALSAAIEPDGSRPAGVLNRLAMALASVEEEPSARNDLPPRGRDGHVGPRPFVLTLSFTLTPVFAARDHAAGLRLLSRALSHLAASPVLTGAETPLPDGVDRLAVDLVTLDFEQRHHLAAAGGLQGLPFAMFRVRGVKLF